MNNTFGASIRVRVFIGQAGSDSWMVRPTTPGKGAPGAYSLIGMWCPRARGSAFRERRREPVPVPRLQIRPVRSPGEDVVLGRRRRQPVVLRSVERTLRGEVQRD